MQNALKHQNSSSQLSKDNEKKESRQSKNSMNTKASNNEIGGNPSATPSKISIKAENINKIGDKKIETKNSPNIVVSKNEKFKNNPEPLNFLEKKILENQYKIIENEKAIKAKHQIEKLPENKYVFLNQIENFNKINKYNQMKLKIL